MSEFSHDSKYLEQSFWEEFFPEFHIGNREVFDRVKPAPLSVETLQEVDDGIMTEGYFHLPPVLDFFPKEHLLELIEKVVELGFPPLLSFLYDETWAIFRQLQPLLAKVLGEDYLVIPSLWAWHLDPRKTEAGWAPHRDKGRYSLMPDGRPNALTVWIPVTPATPLNGCMYLIPANRDPEYGGQSNKAGLLLAAQDIRALPAEPGSVMGWNQNVLHWGGRASPRAKVPRVSISFEYQRRDHPPYRENVFEPDRFPDFKERLGLISQQIDQYDHMYSYSPALKEFSKAASFGRKYQTSTNL